MIYPEIREYIDHLNELVLQKDYVGYVEEWKRLVTKLGDIVSISAALVRDFDFSNMGEMIVTIFYAGDYIKGEKAIMTCSEKINIKDIRYMLSFSNIRIDIIYADDANPKCDCKFLHREGNYILTLKFYEPLVYSNIAKDIVEDFIFGGFMPAMQLLAFLTFANFVIINFEKFKKRVLENLEERKKLAMKLVDAIVARINSSDVDNANNVITRASRIYAMINELQF